MEGSPGGGELSGDRAVSADGRDPITGLQRRPGHTESDTTGSPNHQEVAKRMLRGRSARSHQEFPGEGEAGPCFVKAR